MNAASSQRLSDRHKQFHDNIKLVHFVIHRYFQAHIQTNLSEWDDLFSQGCIGLVKAIDRFDPAKDFKFSPYAVQYIWGEVRHYLRDHCQPAGVKMHREDIKRGIRAQRYSLDASGISSRNYRNLTYDSTHHEQLLWVESVLMNLSQRQRQVIWLNVIHEAMQKDVAEYLGVSTVTVSRDREKAIKQLREVVKAS